MFIGPLHDNYDWGDMGYFYVVHEQIVGDFSRKEFKRLEQKILCQWCKSSYSKGKEHCPNCGGPQIE